MQRLGEQFAWFPVEFHVARLDALLRILVKDAADFHRAVERALCAFYGEGTARGRSQPLQRHLQRRFAAREPDGRHGKQNKAPDDACRDKGYPPGFQPDGHL